MGMGLIPIMDMAIMMIRSGCLTLSLVGLIGRQGLCDRCGPFHKLAFYDDIGI